MNKKQKDEQEQVNFNTFVSLAQKYKDKVLTSKEVSDILKEHQIPGSIVYLSNMIQAGLFIKEGNNKYKFFDGNISFEDYQKPILKSRNQHKESRTDTKKKQIVVGDKVMTSITEEEKIKNYVKFLKSKGYKIQKPIKVPVTIYETRYVDC